MTRFTILLILCAHLSFAQGDVTGVVPPQHGLNVDPSSTVSVTFSRPVQPASLTDSTVFVHGVQSGRRTGTITYDSLNRTATIQPSLPFAAGERVLVTFTGVIGADSALPVAPFSSEFFVATSAADTAAFLPSSLIPTGQYPWALTSADIDGDGDQDLAVVNKGNHSVSIMLNDGNGHFTRQADVVVELDPAAIAAADLDGDDDIDLAVAHTDPPQVSLLLNDGTGLCSVARSIHVGPMPTSLCAADLDGNGRMDLIAGGDSITVLISNGDTTFAVSSFMPSGDNPLAVTTTDVDLDGDTDLLTSNYFSNDISVLLNDGDGRFSEFSRVAVGGYPAGAASGDWDSDGDADLAIISGNYPGTVSIALNQGNGVFLHEWTSVVGSTPLAIVAADANGDGTLDLVTADWESHTLTVLHNDGSGFFNPVAFPSSGRKPRGLTAADFDGDGDIDLATASQDDSTVAVLKKMNPSFVGSIVPAANARQVPAGARIAVTFGTAIDPTSLNDSTITVDGIWTGRHRGSINYSVATRTAEIVPEGSFLPGEEVRVSVNTGVRNMQDDTTAQAYTWVFTMASTPAPLLFGVRQDVAVAGAPCALAPADVNGDGQIDVVAGGKEVSVLLNTGDRSYGVMESWNAGPRPHAIAAGDLDGDGAPDLAVVNVDSTTVRLYFNSGDGTFPFSATVSSPNCSYGQVAIIDYNGDGRQDIVPVGIGAVSYNPAMTSLFRNEGNRVFGWEADLEFGVDARVPSSLVVADFQRDGRLDLAWSSPDVSVFALFMDGQGAETFRRIDVPNDVLTAIDLESDSIVDLASLAGEELWLLKNDGDGFSTGEPVTLAGYAPEAIAAADIDADGDMDVAIARGDSALVSLWLNDGNGVFSRGPGLTLDSVASAVTIADLDGDGDLDVAAADSSAGVVRIFFNEDSSVTARVTDLAAVRLETGQIQVRWNTSTGDTSILGFDVLRRREHEAVFSPVPGGFVGAGYPSDSSHSYLFQDTTAGPGQISYRLRQIDRDSSLYFSQVVTARTITSVPEAFVPSAFMLLQNYPNPFNPRTVIGYAIGDWETGRGGVLVQLTVYDLLGREVAVLVDERQVPGVYQVTFDGAGLASGVYLYRLQAGTSSATRKMLLLK